MSEIIVVEITGRDCLKEAKRASKKKINLDIREKLDIVKAELLKNINIFYSKED